MVCLSAWRDTPPPRTRHPPPPRDQAPPGAGTPPPPEQSILGDMTNEWAVCILLECNLVICKTQNAIRILPIKHRNLDNFKNVHYNRLGYYMKWMNVKDECHTQITNNCKTAVPCITYWSLEERQSECTAEYRALYTVPHSPSIVIRHTRSGWSDNYVITTESWRNETMSRPKVWVQNKL